MHGSQFLSLLLIIAAFWTTLTFKLRTNTWSLLFGGVIIITTLFGHLPIIFNVLCWIVFTVTMLFVHLHNLRRQYIVAPALSHLQNQIPTISKTEREAIEAGDTWWEQDLFCGQPDWQKLLDIPKPQLSEEEEHFIAHEVDQLCGMLNDWEIINDLQDLPPAVWAYLKKERFFALAIPKEYGGRGFSALAHSTIVAKIATRSVSAAVTTMVPNSLGPGELLVHYGTAEQKSQYLPRLASGDDIPCFALTGPEAGSDAGAISDYGIICKGTYEDKEIIGIRLTWEKRYITLAPVATLLGIAFHLYDPDHLIGDNEELGITLCLIPTSHPGVKIGTRHYPMFTSFMNGPTRGKDVFIPLDWIIGGKEKVGHGWRMLMECLSIGRSISLPALSTACGQMTYRLSGAYARVRKQFNTPISTFEGVEEALGRIAGYTYAMNACRLMTAGAVDLKINPAIVSAIAKYHMTEMSRHVIADAMDIHAGQMVQVGPRNLLANPYLAVPISITVEGANILTRNLIIFGQGAIRCHPYLLKEIACITAPEPNVVEVDQVVMGHIGYFVRNFLCAIGHAFTGGYFISVNVKTKKLSSQLRQLTRMSTALALVADASLILLGGSLKRRERLSARLGDVLSNLYIASCTIKYYSDQGMLEDDVANVKWVVANCLFQIQTAFYEIFRNFPIKIVGILLKLITFPFGQAYSPPSDSLHHAIVEPMLSPSALRERMTNFCYNNPNENNLVTYLDKVLVNAPAMEAMIKRINKALPYKKTDKRVGLLMRVHAAHKAGILTDAELEAALEYEKLHQEIIKVNEFSHDLSQVVS